MRTYGGSPTEVDRRVGWRSVIAGYALYAGLFALLVAVSYPLATILVLVVGIGSYASIQALRIAAYERTLEFCRAGFCLRVQLSVG